MLIECDCCFGGWWAEEARRLWCEERLEQIQSFECISVYSYCEKYSTVKWGASRKLLKMKRERAQNYMEEVVAHRKLYGDAMWRSDEPHIVITNKNSSNFLKREESSESGSD